MGLTKAELSPATFMNAYKNLKTHDETKRLLTMVWQPYEWYIYQAKGTSNLAFVCVGGKHAMGDMYNAALEECRTMEGFPHEAYKIAQYADVGDGVKYHGKNTPKNTPRILSNVLSNIGGKDQKIFPELELENWLWKKYCT